MRCPGKPAMEKGLPDRGSSYADEGTAAHAVLEMSLEQGRPASAFVGRLIECDNSTVEVTLDMAGHVQTAIDAIKQIAGTLSVQAEGRVNYSSYLGTPRDEAWGTADVVAVRGTELQVMDLKYGMGVEVDAEDNPQLKLYGLGALEQVRLLGEDPETVRLVILQPRIKSAPSEWTISVKDLEAWGRGRARSAVISRINAIDTKKLIRDRDWEDAFLVPGEKQCKFCRAKATCPKLREDSLTLLGMSTASIEDFEDGTLPEKLDVADVDWLAAVLSKADLIEGWLKSVRGEAESRLLAGQPVPGYKLVQGKAGNRQWTDAADAAQALADLGTEAYTTPTLVSPAVAEKLCKKVGLPLPSTTQTPGRPHVAPASDPRPELQVTPSADGFSAG